MATQDVDQLLASALIAVEVKRDPAQALIYAGRAAERAPQRFDVAWMHATVCQRTPNCDASKLEARLNKLDPHNAAVWMGALGRARAQRDAAAEQQILEIMARAQSFDMYWNVLTWRIVSSIAANNPTATKPPAEPLQHAFDDVSGWLADFVTSLFQPLVAACSIDRAEDAQVRSRCLRIATVLERGDTFIAEGVGLGIEQRLIDPDSPAGTVISQRIRISRYQRETGSELMAAQVEREKFSRELLDLLKSLKREQDVFLAVIRWAGRPVIPRDGD
jgi:hypothetical protein